MCRNVGLPATGRAHDGREFALSYLQIQAVQNYKIAFGRVKYMRDTLRDELGFAYPLPILFHPLEEVIV